ncbi:hypothetical protein [Neisseria zalophi]|uniref:Uncharacterized protein n=1 Tax=Neisseria zalophi TaxID=640030 RepID=A0A5J6PZA5_9NEIS|nr:hypothetical protein [Neisseria zalophi]QEY25496.1 hypothetical protein D0T92_02390 [Neisseria zalophi]QEY26513.1 hypothetical protein D0T92_08205 [Neisseria zalophi]
MSLTFYTVTPESKQFPKSYILQVFNETQDDEVVCVQTVNFPIRNPALPNKVLNEAHACGRMLVNKIMNANIARMGGL